MHNFVAQFNFDKKNEIRNIDEIFLRCSSQTLCGIKPANLFRICEKDFDFKFYKKWKKIIKKLGLCVFDFRTNKNSIIVFVYDFSWIEKILENGLIKKYLIKKGYFNFDNGKKVLNILFERLKDYEEFPHEVGIFLGYPVEDVISFEKQKGKCCSYCGYWKSYCNPEEAKKCCEQYKKCSELCRQWFDEGYSIPQIIRKYKKVTIDVA